MFITNKGITKTKIYDNSNLYDNSNYKSNDIKWDAKYDGKIADINLDVNNNGDKKHLHMNLTNDELAKLLNIPSVGEDLQKRLKNDFKYDGTKPRFIELEEEDINSNNPSVYITKYKPRPRSLKKFSVKRRKNKKNTPKTMRSYI